MKKCFLALLLALLLCSTCFAESSFNVNDYSDDELIAIMRTIYDADTQLGYMYSNSILEVGKDIPAGEYEFWVEEDDINFDKSDKPDYRCGATTLCYIKWGPEHKSYYWDKYVEIFYDQYNAHMKVSLQEGDFVWAQEGSGTNFEGLRMKYYPNRRSGLFTD